MIVKLFLFILLLLSLLVSGCASLAPKEERQVQFIESTSASKATAFNRAQAYIAKNWGNSNHAVRMKDEASGQIVVKGNVVCNALRQSGDPKDYMLAFNMDFDAKDNRVRLVFEDMEMQDQNGNPVQWAYAQLTDKSKVEQVKSCLEPVRMGFTKAISGSDNW